MKKKIMIVEIFIFCLLAFMIRLFLLNACEQVAMDSMNYLTLGYNIVRGNFAEGFSFLWPMLYPVFVGILSFFVADLVFSGCLVSLIFGSLLIIPTYLFCRDIFNVRAARFTSILLIIFPVLIVQSCVVMAESTYLFFFMMAVLVGWKAIRNDKISYYIFTGIILSLCYLTFPAGLFLFVAMLGLMLFINIKEHQRYSKKLLALSLGFIILALPYLILVRIYAGEWTLSAKAKLNIAYARVKMESGKTVQWRWFGGLNEDKSSTVADDWIYGVGPATRPLKLNVPPVPFLTQVKHVTKTMYQFYIDLFPSMFSVIIIILASLGFAEKVFVTSKIPLSHLWLLYFCTVPVCPYFYTLILDRYFLPMVPIILIFAGAGLYNIQRVIRARLLNLCFLFIVIISLFLNMPSLRIKLKDIKNKSNRPIPAYIAAGEWIKSNYVSAPRIMAVSSYVALYANTNRFVLLPAYCPYEEMINYAKLKEVSLIVINERDIKRFDRYRQEFLLDPRNAPRELKLVYQYDNDPQWGRILVYELVK